MALLYPADTEKPLTTAVLPFDIIGCNLSTEETANLNDFIDIFHEAYTTQILLQLSLTKEKGIISSYGSITLLKNKTENGIPR